MRRAILLIYLSVNMFSQLVAQTPVNLTGTPVNNLILQKLDESVREDHKNELVPVEGSIFLNESFIEGEVKSSRGDYDRVSMNYNILSDVFHFKFGSQILVLEPREDVLRVNLGTKSFLIRNYEYKKKNTRGFLEVVVEGKYNLFAKKNITLRPAKPPKALESEGTLAAYSRPRDTYYLEMPNGTLEKVKTGKDVIYLIQEPQFKKEAKAKGISISKTKDLPLLIQLLNYLDL